MRPRVLSSVALAAAVLAIAAPARAQSVLLRLAPESGLQSRYVMGMETHVESAMMPSTGGPFMIGTVHSTQTVLGVEGDVVEYEMRTDSARIETPGMPMLQNQMPDQTGQTMTMKMDTRGRLVSFGEGLPPEMQAMAGQLGGMRLELPEGPVSPGDSWDASIATEIPGIPGGSGAMEMAMTYTLTEVASAGGSRFATISFSGPVSMSGQGGGVGMDAGGDVTGTMVIDVTKGRLASSEMTMTMDMNISGMTMSMSQAMTTTLIN